MKRWITMVHGAVADARPRMRLIASVELGAKNRRRRLPLPPKSAQRLRCPRALRKYNFSFAVMADLHAPIPRPRSTRCSPASSCANIAAGGIPPQRRRAGRDARIRANRPRCRLGVGQELEGAVLDRRLVLRELGRRRRGRWRRARGGGALLCSPVAPVLAGGRRKSSSAVDRWSAGSEPWNERTCVDLARFGSFSASSSSRATRSTVADDEQRTRARATGASLSEAISSSSFDSK